MTEYTSASKRQKATHFFKIALFASLTIALQSFFFLKNTAIHRSEKGGLIKSASIRKHQHAHLKEDKSMPSYSEILYKVIHEPKSSPLTAQVPASILSCSGSEQASLKKSAIEYKIRSGDTYISIWRNIGGNESDASLVASQLDELKVTSKDLKAGDIFQVAFNDAGQISTVSKRLKDGGVLKVATSENNQYRAQVEKSVITERERVISGTILSSFSEAASRSHLPLSMVDDFVDLMGDKIDFRKDLRANDTFSVLFTQKQASDGTWLDVGSIKAVSLVNKNNLHAIIRYRGKDGQVRSFDDKGDLIGEAFLRYPLQFTRITSIFTDSRMHPVLGIRRPHMGVDLAAKIGTPVRVIGDGVVESAGYSGAAGNMVKIVHNKTYSTAYLHLSKISPGVRKGARVSRGDVIGLVGKTGLASGPHPHFSMYQNGKYIDPMKAKLPNVTSTKDAPPLQYVQATLNTLRTEHQQLALANGAQKTKKG